MNNSLDISEDSSVEENNEIDPNNYQFYFDKIQIVGDVNFNEDYKRMRSKPVKKEKSNKTLMTPQTNYTNSRNEKSLNVSFFLIKEITH